MATVLVVEDEEALRQLVAMLLQNKGHDVLQACNGLEGLMVYSSYRARARPGAYRYRYAADERHSCWRLAFALWIRPGKSCL